MIGIVVDELKLAAPGVVVFVFSDRTNGIGDDREALQVVGEVVENRCCAAGEVFAGHAFAIEEDILRGNRQQQETKARPSTQRNRGSRAAPKTTSTTEARSHGVARRHKKGLTKKIKDKISNKTDTEETPEDTENTNH